MLERFKNLNKTAKKNVVCVAVIAVVTLFVGGYALWNNWPSPDVDYSMELSDSTALESHVLAVGDIYWGRRMNDAAQQNALKEAYPFSRLHEFQPEAYDAWIGNLECPAVPGVHHPIGYEPELWEFNCPVEYLPEAAKWFDIFSLANNHTANQEREKGLETTREQLDKHGIQHFGNFNPHTKDDVCEVNALPARANIDGKQQEVYLPIANCGFHGVYYTITDESMAIMQEYAKYMPVIAYPHMGQEYQAISDDVREGLYRKMIDNGADVVLGNHPHWIQPTEVYNGKLIAYSMGNFIFDQQFSTEVMRSAAIDMTLSVAKDDVSDNQLRQWVELGETCAVFKDDCLKVAQEKQYQRLPVNFTYDIVSADLDNMVTKRASLQAHREILDRLNWKDTLQKLE